jgi:hypothetical protein
MRSHVEFRSTDFPAYPSEEEEVNPGRFGKRLAEFLAEQLPQRGLAVRGIGAEDWGWRIDLENATFPLWVGCGNYEEGENAFLCFIEPSKPVLRKWLKKIETAEVVERVASALEASLQSSGKVSGLKWWAEDEGRT